MTRTVGRRSGPSGASVASGGDSPERQEVGTIVRGLPGHRTAGPSPAPASACQSSECEVSALSPLLHHRPLLRHRPLPSPRPRSPPPPLSAQDAVLTLSAPLPDDNHTLSPDIPPCSLAAPTLGGLHGPRRLSIWQLPSVYHALLLSVLSRTRFSL